MRGVKIETYDDGYLAAILDQDGLSEGKEVKVGEPLAFVCEEESDVLTIQELVRLGRTEEVLNKCSRDVYWQAYRKAEEGEVQSGGCMTA